MFLSNQDKLVRIGLFIALALNFIFWLSVRDIQASWNNVPPAPDKKYASAYGLGDKSFAYRLNGLMIQNLGDTGGRTTSLRDYNYESLTKWFFLQDHLDNRSNYIPYLASYYFGGVQNPELFRPVLDYLLEVGKNPEGQKWRWLAQGVFLARYQLKDLDKALELAHVLSSIDYVDAPAWTTQMPAFIMSAKGEKEAAYALLLEILKTASSKMHPNEINAMKAYMCARLMTNEDAATNSLCEGL